MCGKENEEMSVHDAMEELIQTCNRIRQALERLTNRKDKETLALRHIQTLADTDVRINDFQRVNFIAMSLVHEDSTNTAKVEEPQHSFLEKPMEATCTSNPDIPLTEEDKCEYFRLLTLEKELDKELAELKQQEITHLQMEKTMKLLHEYNDIKDATQVVLGAIASMNNITIASLHEEYDLPMNDD